MVEAVTAVAPVIGIAPEELRTALAQMAYLNDTALWQAARTAMTAEQLKQRRYDVSARSNLHHWNEFMCMEVKQDGCRTGSD